MGEINIRPVTNGHDRRLFLTCSRRIFQGDPLWMPLERPSRFFGILFKLPLLLYRLRLGRLVPGWMLLLTTTGRRTGKLRRTMVEFLYRPETGACWVMSGWAGRPLAPDEASLRACAPLFPGLALWEERTN